MKNLLSFGLAVSFFLFLVGCAHTPDSLRSMPEKQVSPAVQTSGSPQEAAAAQTAGPPSVELSETVFDFGRVSVGNDYVHAFKVRNTGTGVLNIRKIMPG